MEIFNNEFVTLYNCDSRQIPIPDGSVDGVVLDPFVGSGTTAAVAQKYGRKSVGVDLNKEYLDIAVRRITSTQPVLL